ncbi:MAG: class I SAM-dependent methyltransferase [Candidatus Bathyarchaeota archaeon]|nr:class I SAM-dependent methyltransferase [Candidatus Bathyarchaeota archaeon]
MRIKRYLKNATRRLLIIFFRSIGKLTRHYYKEDYVRVYPDGLSFDNNGNKIKSTRNDINNFLNHCKFYKFAAQFVNNKVVVDVGCGSGYGCKILKQSGAKFVYGLDPSEHALKFAKSVYGEFADFRIQEITNIKDFPNGFFDVSISNEVLEHIKEYGMEEQAICELKRITRKDGLMIIGTPNNEMLNSHGFSFEEINVLFKKHFSQFCIFENALVPFGNAKSLWEYRLSKGKTGVIVSENISLAETVLPEGVNPEIKKGIDVGLLRFASYCIDTTLLHNTHSWVILAINSE